MRSTQYMTLALSALTIFEGVAAQRGGGRGRENDQSTNGQVAPSSTSAAGAGAQTTTSAANGAGQDRGGRGNNGGNANGANAQTTTTTAAAQGGNQNGNAQTTTTSAAAASSAGGNRGGANGQGNNNNNNNNNQQTTTTSAAAAAATTSAAAGNAGNNGQNGNGGNNGNGANANNAGGATTLQQNVIATGSQSNGNPTDGQAASLTDNANFINFCAGKTITNGEQNQGGSCNPIPMGEIPGKSNMISTVITNPTNGANVQANQQFTIELQTQNLVAGSFTNPANTYYAAPQQLQGGNIVGHAHVTVQDMGNGGNTPPDPTKFAFFKGIDDAGDGNGKLSATVTDGLPAGNYRLCTLMSSSNHQAVLMPVAQRGAQDDCIRFTVGGGGAGGAGGANNNNNNGGNAGAAASSTSSAAGAGAAATTTTSAAGAGAAAATTTTSAAAAATTSAAGQNGGNRGNGGRGGRNQKRRRSPEGMRFVERELIV